MDSWRLEYGVSNKLKILLTVDETKSYSKQILYKSYCFLYVFDCKIKFVCVYIVIFLAPTGAQGVKMSVCPSVRVSVCPCDILQKRTLKKSTGELKTLKMSS